LNTRDGRHWFSVAALALVLTCFLPALQAGLPPKLEDYRSRAAECEKKGQWTEACSLYNQILRSDHSLEDIRERFQVCLRHVHQMRRHRDPSFLKNILSRPLPDALDVYEEVLFRLQANYLEKEKLRPGVLFQQGLQELRFALEDETFLQEHLPGMPLDRIRAFAAQLDQRSTGDVQTVRQAREQARAIGMDALDTLGLEPTVVILEFTCGACNALDEYTFYLTPAMLRFVQASLKGEFVGIGVKVGAVEQRLLVTGVVPGSPADEKGIRPGDRILRLDGQLVEDLSAETVAARLLGKAGTSVELEVLAVGEMLPHVVKAVRQTIHVPSIEWESMPRDGVGYVRILSFQESTVQELKDAILQLQAAQMKALVLDLRGNGGGHLRAAVQVAEIFLTDGNIAFTDSPNKALRNAYKAHNPNELTLPLVVLVNGDTASAAELVAGALKENQRATLVGTTTFGKGSIQYPLTLDTLPSGILLTVAKFSSPSNQPYSGRGVTPHILVDVDLMDAQRAAAWQTAQQLVMGAR
jgi:carboxyl-terminal processing protease